MGGAMGGAMRGRLRVVILVLLLLVGGGRRTGRVRSTRSIVGKICATTLQRLQSFQNSWVEFSGSVKRKSLQNK